MLDRESQATLIAIGRYVSARVARFLELLRSGALVACDGTAIVSARWWQNPSFWVDLREGRLFEQVGDDRIERSGDLIVSAGAPQFEAPINSVLAPGSSTIADKNGGANRPSAFHVKPTEPDALRSRATADSAKPHKHSAVQASIAAAVEVLWPNAIPPTLTIQERIRMIIVWQHNNRSLMKVASEQSIRRHLKRS